MSAQAEAARNLMRARRYADAKSLLGQALASDPDDFELHALLAQAYLGLRQPAPALRAADAATLRAPDDDWPHRLRSLALLRLGRAREAVAAAKQAVRLAPELAFARHVLAEAHMGAKQYDEAYVQALEAVRLSPDSTDMHDLLGRCMLRKRMYREAEAAFRRALTFDPNDAAAHNNLGVVLSKTGRRVDAVHEFNEAARLDPSFETARKNLYSGTRVLVGGGSVVFLLYLLARISVAINFGRTSPGFLLIGATIVVIGLVVWVRRYRPFTRKELPATAVAYYEAEKRRIRRANRPVLLLRIASVPVLLVGVVLSAVFDNGWFFFVGVAVALALLYLSPFAWRRLVERANSP
ncbi:MAG TPA: tetratricopeptide repeat protein [Candidatus Dormibacteraeota bacterium]|nr:tetratricopeptide repeat protein [Candidatus Dormibacteraeota bacterium]